MDVFKQLRHLIPEDKVLYCTVRYCTVLYCTVQVLVPGVIDSTTNFIEHPRLVARRLLEFATIVGKHR